MTGEAAFIAALRRIVQHPGARNLLDDAAVIAPPVGRELVITHDMIAEGVHFLPDDPPGDVAWKLLAVNLSDLAAKGAKPIGAVLGYTLAGDSNWDEVFVAGLSRALEHFDVPLLGGDTISLKPGTPRTLGLTALGEAAAPVPDRRGARAGDILWVCGTIGDAGLGLRIARGEIEGPRKLLKAYRLPMPKLREGRALAQFVTAMADVSDGLLIDAARIAEASGLAATVDLDRMPMSDDARTCGDDRAARLTAATSGDDYALLFAADPSAGDAITALNIGAVAIGDFAPGAGLMLRDAEGPIPLPETLGYLHGN
ncbi:MAG: thiamine-phosphate kinase [Sphingomonadaceae bacterium]